MAIQSGQLEGSLRFSSGSVVNDHINSNAAIARSKLALDSIKRFTIPLTDFRVWDAFHTVLPGTSAADDLALVGGTFGTNSPSIRTYDVKAAGAVTLYARAAIRLPMEYADGETVNLRLTAGMVTTVASTSATIDVEAYESDGDAGISLDLCSTAAQSINSLVAADKDFVITATDLIAGDWLDVRITIAVNDAATATAVIAQFGRAQLLCDVRG